MESKEYFEKVMQDYNQNRKGRSLRKYCKDEAVEVMGGLSSTRRTILYRRNTRNHRKMLSYKLSQLLDKVIERCFRHFAMGRRNWLQTGRHFSAQNLAFMFGLLESCKLNKVNFGEYIVDILTRILCGEEVDALANAIIALLKDEAKREKRQINFVGDKSWKVITEKYIEFYKTII